MTTNITLKEFEKPKKMDTVEDIRWLGNSLGLSAGRDTERMTETILLKIIREIASKGYTSTESISTSLDIPQQKINYHLKSLIDCGLFYRKKRMIYLRHGSLKSAIEEIRKDAERIFDNLSSITEEIDKRLELKNR